jgi:hypothetical protein
MAVTYLELAELSAVVYGNNLNGTSSGDEDAANATNWFANADSSAGWQMVGTSNTL